MLNTKNTLSTQATQDHGAQVGAVSKDHSRRKTKPMYTHPPREEGILSTVEPKHVNRSIHPASIRYHILPSCDDYDLSSGSFRMPSTSSLRRASSRAQVCILLSLLAPNSSQSLLPYISVTLSSSFSGHTLRFRVSHLSSDTKPKPTYEVSGLNAYATTPNPKLPKNPQTQTVSHPSFSVFSPGFTPNNHPPGGS